MFVFGLYGTDSDDTVVGDHSALGESDLHGTPFGSSSERRDAWGGTRARVAVLGEGHLPGAVVALSEDR